MVLALFGSGAPALGILWKASPESGFFRLGLDPQALILAGSVKETA
jgi:hypothetical protein